MPILDEMLEEQNSKKVVWTPSKMIAKFGEKINNPDSVYYWCFKNNIPVYCPAITDVNIVCSVFLNVFLKKGSL